MKKIIRGQQVPLLLITLIAFSVTLFYLRFINFSIDTIILFLSSKIFLGKWIAKGVLPLYNPQIYLGIPFAFDVGLGNFHPFNLLFILPYPYSFAIWAGIATFLLLVGFYGFFRFFTKTALFATLLTLILFFSGSGFLRMNNPTIYLVIAHYGLYLYSLQFLSESKKTSQLLPLITGVLLTLAGHIQFVFYGYFLGLFVSLFVYRIPFRKVLVHYLLLFFLTSWYYVLSLPLIVQSTRLTFNQDYVKTGNNGILQYAELFLPYFLGYFQNGSRWNIGPTYTILVSLWYSSMLGYLFLKRKVGAVFTIFMGLFFIASLGLVNLPFFRGAGQATILLHIIGLLAIARHEEVLLKTVKKISNSLLIRLLLIATGTAVIFFYSDLFRIFFLFVYRTVKHGPPGLFFDNDTIQAVGHLIGLSFVSVVLFLGSLLLAGRTRKIMVVLLVFVIIEGVMINYFHGFYIPAAVITQSHKLAAGIDTKGYRIQTASDVVPYFGIASYMGDLLFRPPFSKEKTIYTPGEQKTFSYLSSIFSFVPSTWIMTTDYTGVQGFNTFIPKKLTDFFKDPSRDFKDEYSYIISRNSLLAGSKNNTSINAIETTQITLNDPRWQELGVRYFISDRPLPKYRLIAKDNRFFYENPETKPIYRLENGNYYSAITPSYQDPNQMIFTVRKEDVGKELVLTINPDGFASELDGRPVAYSKRGFSMTVPLTHDGKLKIYYSPLFHLSEVLTTYLK